MKKTSKRPSPKNGKFLIARNPTELAVVLGLPPEEGPLMEQRAILSEMARSAIKKSGMTVNEITEKSGVSRQKVSYLKNGSTRGMTIDLMIKVIIATGHRLKISLVA